jgi:hypothetical protein
VRVAGEVAQHGRAEAQHDRAATEPGCETPVSPTRPGTSSPPADPPAPAPRQGRVHRQARVQFVDAKFILVAMTAKTFSVAHWSDPGMLDIAGFDAAVPNFISNSPPGPYRGPLSNSPTMYRVR